MSTALLLLALTGEERYPPGDVPLSASFTRALAPLLSAALFTPSTRRALVVCGNKAGLNHVTVSLSHVTHSELRWLSGGAPLRKANASTTSATAREGASRKASEASWPMILLYP